jgi:hypothetical protein
MNVSSHLVAHALQWPPTIGLSRFGSPVSSPQSFAKPSEADSDPTKKHAGGESPGGGPHPAMAFFPPPNYGDLPRDACPSFYLWSPGQRGWKCILCDRMAWQEHIGSDKHRLRVERWRDYIYDPDVYAAAAAYYGEGSGRRSPQQLPFRASPALPPPYPVAGNGGGFGQAVFSQLAVGSPVQLAGPRPAHGSQWAQYTTPEGVPYYHNPVTGATTWHPPPSHDAQPQAPPLLAIEDITRSAQPAEASPVQLAQPNPHAYHGTQSGSSSSGHLNNLGTWVPNLGGFSEASSLLVAPSVATPAVVGVADLNALQSDAGLREERWVEHVADNGMPYYYNVDSRESTWLRPVGVGVNIRPWLHSSHFNVQ